MEHLGLGDVDHAAPHSGHEVQGAHERNAVQQRAVKVVNEVGFNPRAGGVVGRVQRLKAGRGVAQQELVGTAKEPVLDEPDRIEFFGEEGAKARVPVGGSPKAGLPKVLGVEAQRREVDHSAQKAGNALPGLKREGGPRAAQGDFARTLHHVTLSRRVAQVGPYQGDGVGAKGRRGVELPKKLVGPILELEVGDGLAAREVKGGAQVEAVHQFDAVRTLKEGLADVVSAGKRAQYRLVGVDKSVVVAQFQAKEAKLARLVEVTQGEVAAQVAVDDAVVEVAFDVEAALVGQPTPKAPAEVVPVASDAKEAHLGHDRKHEPLYALFAGPKSDPRHQRFPPVEFVVDRVDAVFVAVGVVVQRQAVLKGYVPGLAGLEGDFAGGRPVGGAGVEGIVGVGYGGEPEVLGSVGDVKGVAIVQHLGARGVARGVDQLKAALGNDGTALGEPIGLPHPRLGVAHEALARKFKVGPHHREAAVFDNEGAAHASARRTARFDRNSPMNGVAFGFGLEDPRPVLKASVPSQGRRQRNRHEFGQFHAPAVEVQVPVGVGFKKMPAGRGGAVLGHEVVVAAHAELDFGASPVAQALPPTVLVGEKNPFAVAVGRRKHADAQCFAQA